MLRNSLNAISRRITFMISHSFVARDFSSHQRFSYSVLFLPLLLGYYIPRIRSMNKCFPIGNVFVTKRMVNGKHF